MNRSLLSSLSLALLLAAPCLRSPAAETAAAAVPSAPVAAAAATPPELPLQAFAAIGTAFARTNHLEELGWSEAQIAAFLDGIRATFHGGGYPFDDAARTVSAEMGRRVHEIELRQERARHPPAASPGEVEAYMKETTKRLHLQRTDSGLAFALVAPGGGNRPGPDDTIVVSFVAKDANLANDLPQLAVDHAHLKVSAMVPGLAEGVQLMAVGAEAVFVVPPDLSFGQGPWPAGIEHAPLVFKLTLHEVLSPATNP
ncbi:MAG TPA: FKBP-type peptidyl-prolyl cis-trans isomerase [Lacunisphaera sp.]|nr:FKBP-type peptidyl-prolyl cis-trans isomerase [Lacunisphaera sp.]